MANFTTKYCSGITTQLAYWMARGGLTDVQIAAELGVSEKTLNDWKRRHPELRDALKPGKDFVDYLVQGSLLKRALGFEHVEITRERAPTRFEVVNGVAVPVKFGMKVTKKVTKLYPGEVGAQAFWLKNRQGWKDRYDLKHSGEIAHRQDLSSLSDHELEELRAITSKLEAPVAGRN